MAVIEKSGLMKYKDKSGNTYLMYPITNTDNIDGLDEAIAEAKPLVVTVTQNEDTYTADKTYVEIKAAYDAGRFCIAYHTSYATIFMLTGFGTGDGIAYFNASINGADINLNVHHDGTATTSAEFIGQKRITAKGLLKGNGSGNISAATAGTDYVTPDGMNTAIEAAKVTVDTAMSTTSENPVQNKVIAAAIDSAIQSAIQNTWEASY